MGKSRDYNITKSLRNQFTNANYLLLKLFLI